MSKKEDEKKSAEVVERAQKRHDYALAWESTARSRYLDDIRFANADPDNAWQWPMNYYNDRMAEERPIITVNKTRQLNLNIINEGKQNKPAIKFRATGGGASAESARVYDAIARHIEYQSDAQSHYEHAATTQVQAGIGYLRVLTDYCDMTSFDQEIFVKSIPDALSVALDPDAKEPVKGDARWGFIFEDIPDDRFEIKYPKYKDLMGQTVFGDSSWMSKDHTRVAEYYEVEEIEDELIFAEGMPEPMFASVLRLTFGPDNQFLADKSARRRPIFRKQVLYHFIVGDHLILSEEKVWPGTCIPIIPVIGEETVIQGQMDRKGHTRAIKDAQRMYNYWSAAGVEYGALQTKTPWITAIEAIDGYQEYWETANLKNHAYLPFKSKHQDGTPIPPPSRTEPPVPSPVALKGMEIANMEMQMASGQYDNAIGKQGNERTGEAIWAREHQGDKATFHFTNNLAKAIRQVGKIVLELVPKIYDTERVISVIAEDGEAFDVKINPAQQEAYQEEKNEQGKVVARVLNPSVGKYEVQADVGPAYATKKAEAFNALTLIMTQAPQLTAIIGDLLFRAGDFPMSEEVAKRLRRMVPPQALGEGPTPTEAQLAEQIEGLKKALVAAMEELAQEKTKGKARLEKRDVEIYNAITNRIKALGGPQALGIDQMETLVSEVLQESADVPISDVFEQNAEDYGEEGTGVTGMDIGMGGLPLPGDQKPLLPEFYRHPNGQTFLSDPRLPNNPLKVKEV